MDSHRLARVHWLHTISKAKYIVIHFYFSVLGVIRYQKTRMHSSRMRTARSSSHHGGSLHPPRVCTPTPLEQAPPWLDPPQLPPWVWAWRPSSGQIPLGCGPENLQGMLNSTPPSWRPAARHAGIPPAMHTGIAPPPQTKFLTHASENITLPQTSFAGGNKASKCFPWQLRYINVGFSI